MEVMQEGDRHPPTHTHTPHPHPWESYFEFLPCGQKLQNIKSQENQDRISSVSCSWTQSSDPALSTAGCSTVFKVSLNSGPQLLAAFSLCAFLSALHSHSLLFLAI